jgi:uncharacterized protein (TIGR03435 family)
VRGRALSVFAGKLERIVDRVVVDRTRLDGLFDASVEYETWPVPESRSIHAALEKQLGLKLQSSRGPVEVVVIDAAERPWSN